MSVHRKTKTVNVEQDGDDYQIVFDCKYGSYLYGEDADGNRGEKRTELLDTEVIDSYKNGHIIMSKDIPDTVMIMAEAEVEG